MAKSKKLIPQHNTIELAIIGLRSMGVTTDAIAKAIIEGRPVKNRNHPNDPFVVEKLEQWQGFSKSNWIVRSDEAPVKSTELHNLEI